MVSGSHRALAVTGRALLLFALGMLLVPAHALAGPVTFDADFGGGGGGAWDAGGSALSAHLGLADAAGMALSGDASVAASGIASACGDCAPVAPACCCPCFPWWVLLPLGLIPIFFFLDGDDDSSSMLTTGGPLAPPPPPTPTSIPTVPEPSSIVLLGAGALGFFLWQLRKRRRAHGHHPDGRATA